MGGQDPTVTSPRLIGILRVLHLPIPVDLGLLDVFGVEATHVEHFELAGIEHVVFGFLLQRILR